MIKKFGKYYENKINWKERKIIVILGKRYIRDFIISSAFKRIKIIFIDKSIFISTFQLGYSCLFFLSTFFINDIILRKTVQLT